MSSPDSSGALDRARSKAYLRLLPLLFICYVIAYVDRVNVGFAKLNMQGDLAHLGFSESVFGFGMGIFFIGYLLLEIPGTLLVEKWSARKWISRIMISWGIIAAMTAFVHYRDPVCDRLRRVGRPHVGRGARAAGYRADLGWLEQAAGAGHRAPRAGRPTSSSSAASGSCSAWPRPGSIPGVIVYLTHWFPAATASRALAWFFIGTPIAQIIGPPISGWLMGIGTGGNPRSSAWWGGNGSTSSGASRRWSSGFVVLAYADRLARTRPAGSPTRSATALEAELPREKAEHGRRRPHDGPPGPVPPQGAGCWRRPTSSWSRATTASSSTWPRSSRTGTARRQERRRPDRHPADRLAHRPGLHRLELRPDARAAVARVAADHLRRDRAGADPGEPGDALADGRPVHPGDDRAEGVSARLLDPAQPVHGRVGRRGEHRPDQLVRQPRRLGRPDGGRRGPAVHRLLPRRALVPRRLDGRLGDASSSPSASAGGPSPTRPPIDLGEPLEGERPRAEQSSAIDA